MKLVAFPFISSGIIYIDNIHLDYVHNVIEIDYDTLKKMRRIDESFISLIMVNSSILICAAHILFLIAFLISYAL